MLFDTVDIYKFGRVYSKKNKQLELESHFSNNNLMDGKKLITLVSDLSDAWDASHLDVQVQIRFVPRGTGKDEE